MIALWDNVVCASLEEKLVLKVKVWGQQQFGVCETLAALIVIEIGSFHIIIISHAGLCAQLSGGL